MRCLIHRERFAPSVLRHRRPPTPRPTTTLSHSSPRFPLRVVLRMARETGFVLRHRRLDTVSIVCTLTLETGPLLQTTVEALREACDQRTPDAILSMGGSTSGLPPSLSSICVSASPTDSPNFAPLWGIDSRPSRPPSPTSPIRTLLSSNSSLSSPRSTCRTVWR